MADDQRPKPARLDYSDISIRERLRAEVNPDEVVNTLVTIMRDPTASQRDRLHAVKIIADRRDGMPVGMVLTGHVSVDHALAELPEAALAQLEATVRKYQTHELDDGDGFGDDD